MVVKLSIVLIVLLTPCIFGTSHDFRKFHSFQVLRVNASTQKELQFLLTLEQNGRLDFWTQPSIQRPTDIMASSDDLSTLKRYLNSNGIPFQIMIQDVEKIIAEERESIDTTNVRVVSDEINWESYYPFDSISKWLDKLAVAYPQLCSTEVIGRSSEGRDLKVIKISQNNDESKTEKVKIWIDSGIHAREWISPAVATFIINELVTGSHNYSDFLSKVDFHILPVLNPDGYDHTWTKDRLWRKTRSNRDAISATGQECLGVDANRNFGYKYGGSGTSVDPCSDIYRGPEAFSEPETKAVRDYILRTQNIQAYLTLHSYSQVWVYPWGYASELPLDWEELDSLARAGVAALRNRFGTRYQVGSSTNVLYAAAGGSDDWAKSIGIKYSYTIELRDTGSHGFLLPSAQIQPTVLETWDGIQVVARHLSSQVKIK